jgi:hypothetical protein
MAEGYRLSPIFHLHLIASHRHRTWRLLLQLFSAGPSLPMQDAQGASSYTVIAAMVLQVKNIPRF